MLKKSLIDSWNFFTSHWVAFSFIILPIFGVFEIFNIFYESRFITEDSGLSDQLPVILVFCLAYPIVRAALVLYIDKQVSGQPVSVSECMSFGFSHWLPFFALTMILITTIFMGFALLIIPGVYLMVRYSFAELNFLLKKDDVMQSIQSSWYQTKEYFGLLLAGYVIITVCLYGPYIFISFAIDGDLLIDKVFALCLDLVYFVLDTLYLIFAYRVYSELNGSN